MNVILHAERTDEAEIELHLCITDLSLLRFYHFDRIRELWSMRRVNPLRVSAMYETL